MSLGIVVDIVHAGQARNETLHGVVWSGDAVQHLGDGQADSQQHAVEDVEDQHTGERGQSEEELAAAERGQPPEAGDVDQAGGGVHDEGAEGRGWEVGEHRPGEDQDRRDAGQSDQ